MTKKNDNKLESSMQKKKDKSKNSSNEINAELKNLKKILADIQFKYELITKNVTDIIWSFNIDSKKFNFISPSIKNITGYTQDEFLKMDLNQFLTKSSVLQVFNQIVNIKNMQFKSPSETPALTELEVINKNGDVIATETTARVILNENNVPFELLGVTRDITERKMNLDNIERGKRNLQTLFDTVEEMVFILDMEGNVLQTNKAALSKLNYTEAEIKKMHVLDTHSLDRKEEAIEVIGKMMKGELDTCFIPVLTKDGEEIDVETKVSIGEWDDKNVLFGVSRDIRKRKWAENIIKNQHALAIALNSSGSLDEALDVCLDAAIDMSGLDCGGIYIIEHDSKNLVLKSHRGLSEEFIKESSLYTPESDRYKLISYSGPFYIDYDKEMDNKPQSHEKEKIFSLASLPIKHKNELIGCFNIASHKVSEIPARSREVLETIAASVGGILKRLRTEEILKMREEQLALYLDSATDVFILFDSDLNLVEINEKGLQVFNVKNKSDVMGKNITWLNPEIKESTRLDKYFEIIKTGKSKTYNEILMPAELRNIILQIKAFKVGDGLGMMITDITEQKQIEEELQKIEKLESIGILAGGIAHDFNNMLVALMGNISLAKLKIDNNHESYEHLIEAELAISRVKGLTKQLLTFSKGGSPVTETADIRDLVKESITFTLRGTNIKSEFIFDDDLAPVDIDKGQIVQVLNNLTINAIQAMPNGGHLTVALNNYLTKGTDNEYLFMGEKYVCLSISDTGEGIDEDIIEKIFDPYFSTKEKGSGLGLATAFSIIKKHNGYLTVDSSVSVGITFKIYFPISTREIVQDEKAPSTQISGEGKVLVMDDDIVVLKTIEEMLQVIGYEVVISNDGSEAIKIYEEHKRDGKPFDVVIFDITVPGGMGGMQAMKMLKRDNNNIKAIASTGYAQDANILDYKKSGFKDVINKPYTINELNEKISDVLNTKKDS